MIKNENFSDNLIMFISVLSFTLFDREGLIKYFYASQLIFYAYYFIFVFKRRIKWVNKIKFTKIYLIFLFICISSIIWTLNQTESFSKVSTILIIYLNIIITYDFFNKSNTIKPFIFAVITSTYINLLIVLNFLPDSTIYWDQWRFQGTRDNPNYLGSLQLLSIASAIILKKLFNITSLLRYFITFSIIVSSYLVFLTASKKGIIFCAILLVYSIVDHLFFSKIDFKKTILIILITLSIIYFSENLILLKEIVEIERILYRFTEFFEGEGTSTEQRIMYVSEGFGLFIDNPITGIGIGSLKSYFGTYSHSNFIELLTGVGFIGFIIFYSIYFNIFLVLSRIKSKIKYFFYILLLCLLLMDFTQVTYYYKFSILSLLFIAFVIENIDILHKNKTNNDNS